MSVCRIKCGLFYDLFRSRRYANDYMTTVCWVPCLMGYLSQSMRRGYSNFKLYKSTVGRSASASRYI